MPSFDLSWQNLLDSMQDAVEQCVPLDEPYTWNAVGSHVWSEEELQAAFSSAGVIEVQSPNQPVATPFANGAPLSAGIALSQPPLPASTTIRVSKVGVLNRKDDIGLRGRRNAFRKWRSWSVLLTGSQLLFYRDPSLADDVLRVLDSDVVEGGVTNSTSRASLVKPDEILSVKDAIAVYDRTYTKVSLLTIQLTVGSDDVKARTYRPICAIQWTPASSPSFQCRRHGRVVD